MQKLIRICLSFTMPALAMAQFSPIGATRYNNAMSAKSYSGDIFLAARKVLVDVTVPKWHSGRGGLLVLFDQSSGYFLWDIMPVPRTQQTAGAINSQGTLHRFYVATDRIVDFFFGYPDLVITEYRDKANNLDEAEAKALAEANRRGLAVLAYKPSNRVFINVGKLLPRGIEQHFAAPPGRANSGPFKLVDVVHKGNTWEVTLEGQWQEKFTLNDKYEVTAMARLN